MVSSVTYVRHRKFAACEYVVSVLVLALDDTPALAFWFNTRRECSAVESDFYLKKWKIH